MATVAPGEFPREAFADALLANQNFAREFVDSGLPGTARRGLAIITCMDSRVNPLAIVGMEAGDVKILRNAGARVSDDVLRTLVLATYLLGVQRVLVMPHTDCRMTQDSDSAVHELIANRHGVDTRSLEFRTVADQRAALASDIARISAFPYLPRSLIVGGAIYDVHTGNLEPIDC